VITPETAEIFRASCRYGRQRLGEVIAAEAGPRRIPAALAREYLERHIVNELGPREYEGMELYLRYAREAGLLSGASRSVPCAL
jgi:hypothetical protein